MGIFIPELTEQLLKSFISLYFVFVLIFCILAKARLDGPVQLSSLELQQAFETVIKVSLDSMLFILRAKPSHTSRRA